MYMHGSVSADWIMRVEHAIDRMNQDLSQPLLLSELARSAPFSRFHFHRIFQAVTSLTPGRFLAALRMAEARRLLLHSALAVCVIGPQVGYTSVGTFTTQFTRHVGMPPEQFRKVARAAARHRGQVFPGPAGGVGPVVCPEHWQPGELLVVGWRAAAGGAVESCVAVGPGPTLVPLPGDGRTYRVRVFLVRASGRPTQALVDQHSDSYLVGAVAQPLTAGGPATAPVRVSLRRPRAIDPPLLSAAPLVWLAESAGSLRLDRSA